jgi:hypothetical protein
MAAHQHLVLWVERIDVNGKWADKNGHEFTCSSDLDEFHGWMARAWFQIVGSGDKFHLIRGCHWDYVESPERVAAYVAKYVGKAVEGDEELGWKEPGRFWGAINRQRMMGVLSGSIHVVTRAEYVFIRRLLRRFGIASAKRRAAKLRAKGKRADWRRSARSWSLASLGLGTWNTFDRGRGAGSVAGRCMEKLESDGVHRVVGRYL